MINTVFISFSQSLKIYRSETLMFHERSKQADRQKESSEAKRESKF